MPAFGVFRGSFRNTLLLPYIPDATDKSSNNGTQTKTRRLYRMEIRFPLVLSVAMMLIVGALENQDASRSTVWVSETVYPIASFTDRYIRRKGTRRRIFKRST